MHSGRTYDKFQPTGYGEHFFNDANFLLYHLTELAGKKAGNEELAASAHQKFEMAIARLQAAEV